MNRKQVRHALWVLACIFVGLTSPSALASPLYSVTNLSQLQPLWINDQGQVGLTNSWSGGGGYYGFVPTWGLPPTNYVYNSFGPSAGSWSMPLSSTTPSGAANGDTIYAFNSAGDTTGLNSQRVPFVSVGGVQTLLAPANSAAPFGINSSGQVVGILGNNGHAFIYSGGVIRDIGTLGGPFAAAIGINDSGVVVGFSLTPGYGTYANEVHAFMYDGAMHDLGSGTNHAYAINNAGVIVGDMTQTGWPTWSAFMMKNGVLNNLNNLLPPDSGWVLEAATGINNLGQIVGIGTKDGRQDAFLLTPSALGSPPDPTYVPEPSAIFCFSGLLAVAIFRWQSSGDTGPNSRRPA